jgi:hypothetical protein
VLQAQELLAAIGDAVPVSFASRVRKALAEDAARVSVPPEYWFFQVSCDGRWSLNSNATHGSGAGRASLVHTSAFSAA